VRGEAITFVLIPGAWHGSWCWTRLEPELAARGHRAIAVDLPVDDPTASFDDHADAVAAAIGDIDDVVLVGHSLGAHAATFAARRRRPRRLVYLCGVVPSTTETDGAPDEPRQGAPGTYAGLARDGLRRTYWPPGTAAVMYADLSPEDIAWAEPRLRPQGQGIWESFRPFDRLDDLPIVSIVGRRDVLLTLEWQRWACERRLGGLEPIELDVGHFPMLTHPTLVADVLVEVAGPARVARSGRGRAR
jgi:pimeloyl-ACP methyl ester carboxylesterase